MIFFIGIIFYSETASRARVKSQELIINLFRDKLRTMQYTGIIITFLLVHAFFGLLEKLYVLQRICFFSSACSYTRCYVPLNAVSNACPDVGGRGVRFCSKRGSERYNENLIYVAKNTKRHQRDNLTVQSAREVCCLLVSSEGYTHRSY